MTSKKSPPTPVLGADERGETRRAAAEGVDRAVVDSRMAGRRWTSSMGALATKPMTTAGAQP